MDYQKRLTRLAVVTDSLHGLKAQLFGMSDRHIVEMLKEAAPYFNAIDAHGELGAFAFACWWAEANYGIHPIKGGGNTRDMRLMFCNAVEAWARIRNYRGPVDISARPWVKLTPEEEARLPIEKFLLELGGSQGIVNFLRVASTTLLKTNDPTLIGYGIISRRFPEKTWGVGPGTPEDMRFLLVPSALENFARTVLTAWAAWGIQEPG